MRVVEPGQTNGKSASFYSVPRDNQKRKNDGETGRPVTDAVSVRFKGDRGGR